MSAEGVSRTALWKAVRAGRVERPIAGIYCSPETLAEPGLRYAALTLANPGCVVCLLSAARIHEVGDEDPSRVWVALKRSDTHNPARDGPSAEARTVWWQDAMFESGIETRPYLGIEVRLTDLPRTVCDLIRMRGKLGDEIAMKALHDFVRLGGSMGDLWRIAGETGGVEAIEPFIRAAEEFRESVSVRGI